MNINLLYPDYVGVYGQQTAVPDLVGTDIEINFLSLSLLASLIICFVVIYTYFMMYWELYNRLLQ